MRVELKDRRFAPEQNPRPLIERCINFAFAGLRAEVKAVRIDVADVMESRDGKDKRCLVKVRLSTRQEVVSEVMDSDLDVAIHRAVERAGWTSARWLQRARRRSRRWPDFERAPTGHPNPDRAA